jgi:c-di-GMP-binding flagellar brake protein YcgR
MRAGGPGRPDKWSTDGLGSACWSLASRTSDVRRAVWEWNVAKSVAERRRHKRHRVSCPVSLVASAKGKGSEETVRTRTVDVSDGGAMLAVPIKVVPRLSERVRVVLNVPRQTPNTRMVEEVSCEARVVRHQPMEDNEVVGVALQFQQVQALGLEV